MTTSAVQDLRSEVFYTPREVVAETCDDTAALAPREIGIAIRAAPASWLPGLLKQLDAFAGVPANWDSYGAESISDESVSHARRILQLLAQIENIEAPTVGATPDGDVGFCWDVGAWSLDAWVEANGTIQYVFIDETNRQNDISSSTKQASELVPFLTRWPARLDARPA